MKRSGTSSSSTSSAASKKINMVQTWLSEIGLETAWTSFEAAGIVTPSALTQLDASHFAALGVQTPEDRRKLFFLVQRIKMEPQQSNIFSTVTSVSSSQRESDIDLVAAVPVQSQCRDDATDQQGRRQATRVSPFKENHKPSEAAYTKTLCTVTTTAGTSPRRAPPIHISSSSHRGLGASLSPRSIPTTVLSSPRQHATTPESFVSAVQHHNHNYENFVDDDDEFFDSFLADDDDQSIENKSSLEDSDYKDESVDTMDLPQRRQSRRLLEKQQATGARSRQTNGPSSTKGGRPTNGPITSMRNKKIDASSNHSSAPKLIKSASEILEDAINGDLVQVTAAVADFKKTTLVGRKSGLAVPSHRPSASSDATLSLRHNPGKSMRTGKQLSSIPAGIVPPMSPLIDLKVGVQGETPLGGRTTARSRRRSSSLDGVVKRQLAMSRGRQADDDTDNDSVSSHHSLGSKSASERSLGRQSRLSCGSSDRSVGSTTQSSGGNRRSILTGRSSSADQSRRSSIGAERRRPQQQGPHHSGGSTTAAAGSLGTSKSHSFGAMAQHQPSRFHRNGVQLSSWKNMIEELRLDNASEYELFGGTEPLTNQHCTANDEEMRIRVVVRKRPMSVSEIAAAGDVDVIHPLDYGTYGRVLVYQPKTRVDLTKQIETVPFAFDNAFDCTVSNSEIYERSIRNLIPSLFEGQWASIFAYGQTGSGKTFTMMGNNLTGMNNKETTRNTDVHNLGLYYMAALDVFHAIKTPGFEDFSVRISLFEIYGGKLFDLLNQRATVKCLENSKGNVCFPGLSEHTVANADELIGLIEKGASHRSTGTTSRNADSSRSHAVLQLHLYKDTLVGRRRSDKAEEYSRLTFIDLAGSERGADTFSASRATRTEGAEINTSLLALKEVIRVLATGDSLSHVPFRGSKLTQVLKQSFVGKSCRSVMIACISPNIGNCEQTLNTLRYADRVKERNPETGELATGVLGNCKATNTPIVVKRVQSSRSDASFATSSSAPDNYSANSYSSQNSDMLEELLASPQTASDAEDGFGDEEALDHCRVVEDLIATHKDAMTVMLNMVKEEMSLVNQVDVDRERMDEYIEKVRTFQDEQLAMITILREQLLQYRLSQANVRPTHEGGNDMIDVDVDGSFEDLRD